MSETVIIIAEIVLGIAILGVLSAGITLVMTRQLGTGARAAEILRERYARGELTREQYGQMRQDLVADAGEQTSAPPANGRTAAASGERMK